MHEALLIVRLLVGLGMAAHGSQKLFGWFKGYGLHNTGEFLVSLGFPPGPAFASLAGLGEFAGGLLVALGLGGPVGSALLIVVMVTAAGTVHWKNGFFATNNGWELPMAYSLVAVLLAFTGPGFYSADHLLGLDAWTSVRHAWMAVGAGVAIGLANVVISKIRKAAAPAPAATH